LLCSEKGREIRHVEFPVNGETAWRAKGDMVRVGQFGERVVKASHITQRLTMGQSETQGFPGVIETDDFQMRGEVRNGGNERERIRSCAQTDIPNGKSFASLGNAIEKTELADVKCFGFGDGSDDRMKGFGIRNRPDAVSAVFQLDQLVLLGHVFRLVS